MITKRSGNSLSLNALFSRCRKRWASTIKHWTAYKILLTVLRNIFVLFLWNLFHFPLSRFLLNTDHQGNWALWSFKYGFEKYKRSRNQFWEQMEVSTHTRHLKWMLQDARLCYVECFTLWRSVSYSHPLMT